MSSWWRTAFGEEELARIAAAIECEHISQGPLVEAFEQALADYLGVPHVIATTSGSMALLMAMIAHGVGPGDEVIVPNRTWIATAHAPHLLGAKVILADVEADKPLLDPAALETLIGPRTKAIIPVHVNGRSAQMRTINRIAHSHGVAVIEDAAQAFGSRNEDGLLGTQSSVGCFSLSVTKIISTGQGGYLATRDDTLAQRLRRLRTHGVENVQFATWEHFGFNFRFTDIQAAIGQAQLGRMPERIDHLQAMYRTYQAGLASNERVHLTKVNIDEGEIPVYTEVLCAERQSLMDFLRAKGVDSRPFYPDLDTASYFGKQGRFTHSRIYQDQGIYLPSGPTQSPSHVARTLELIQTWSQR